MKQGYIARLYRFRLLILGLLLLPLFAAAQNNHVHVLRIQGGPEAMTSHVQKHIHELAADLDEGARVSFHHDLVKVKLKEEVNSDQLLAAFNQMGVGTFVLEHADRETTDGTFPKYVDTGEAHADKVAYEQAKAQWIANNPELYEQMSGANEEQTTVKPN